MMPLTDVTTYVIACLLSLQINYELWVTQIFQLYPGTEILVVCVVSLFLLLRYPLLIVRHPKKL